MAQCCFNAKKCNAKKKPKQSPPKKKTHSHKGMLRDAKGRFKRKEDK